MMDFNCRVCWGIPELTIVRDGKGALYCADCARHRLRIRVRKGDENLNGYEVPFDGSVIIVEEF